MKNNAFVVIILLFSSFTLLYSNPDKFQTEASFIKNEGQYDKRNWQKNNPVLYAVDYDDTYIFFTNKGLTYRFDKIIKNPDHKEGHDSPKRTNISELVHVTWINSNPDVEIIPEDKIDAYYSYAIRNFETREVTNKNYIPGYRKITYKNLYNNIDVVYTIHPQGGIKYSIILHPGADPSVIKMKYSSAHTNVGSEKIRYKLNDNNEIIITTSQGEITEHKPNTFYTDSKIPIVSHFTFSNNILSFVLGNYDNSQSITIDPWVVSPNFNTSTAVWEVETDASGNVYVIGGETPMELRKYDINGNWQWTYTTPWDTASVWLGTLATNAAGESFITSGTSPEIERVSSTGAMAWHNASFSLFGLTEWWSITFNCDKSKLIVGGTGGSVPPLGTPLAVIYDMDITNGNVIDMETVHTGGSGGLANYPIEVRSISSSKDAKYIFLTHQHVGAIIDNIGLCPSAGPIFKVDNGHHLGYKCENYLPATQNGGGLKALIANDQYFYTNAGDMVYQRSLADGTLINSASIPGGNATTGPLIGGIVVHNSGMAVDDCGNVYVGSGDRVVKYDANLNILQQANVPFSVYDVSVNTNGEVIAVGAQYDNQSVNRNGQIQAINMSACAQFALVCCDINICPVSNVCDTDPPFDIQVSSPGGTFSGPGIVNSTTGTFDPSVSGTGTFTIVYSKPCGSDSIQIVVNPCVPIEVCLDGTNLVASGGVSSFTWYDWETTTINITTQAECDACGGFWNPGFPPLIPASCSISSCNVDDWVQIGTGSTLSTSAINTWPIMITDGTDTVTFADINAIPPCDSCTNPTLSASVTDVTCAGGTDGAIDLTITPGSGSSYTTQWSGPGGFSSINEDINNLSAGNYTVTVTDASNGNCYATLNITVNDGAPLDDPSFTFSNFCEGATNSATITGTPGGTFSFNPVPTNGETINPSTGEITGGIGGNTYTVEYTTNGACPASSTQNVTVYSNPTITISGSTSFCTGGSTLLDAGTGYSSYSWSTGATTHDITVSSAGNYSVTVTDANGCTGTDQVTVISAANLTPTITGILSICSGASTTLDAGPGYASYLWSTSATSQQITISSAGTYSVTVADASGCTGTDQVTVTANSNPTPTITGSLSFCTGNSTILDAGSGYVSYSWSPSGSTQTISVNTAGTYSVTVTDDNGCTGIDQVDVTVAANLTPTITGVLAICNGASTTLDAGAGYSSYNWSTGSTTQTINVSSAGTYSVTVSDAGGCTGTDQVNVTANSNPTPSISGALSFCTGNSTTLDAGAGYIGYLWSTGATSQTLNVTSAGTYSVTVTDSNGCTGTDQVDVTVAANLTPTISGILNFCTGSSTTLDAGSGYASYLWSTSEITQTIQVSSGGTYSVTVADASGCTGTDQVTVTENSNPTPVISGSLTICPGSSTTLDAGSGYSGYLWNDASTSQTINVNTAGTYSVTVTDNNGCSGSSQVNVTESPAMTLVLTPTDLNCNGDLSGSITSSCTGGSAPFTYNWSNGSTNQDLNNIAAGTYTLTVTDGNGCTIVESTTVQEPTPVVVSSIPDKYICSGQTATLVASVSGGTTPYTYYWNGTAGWMAYNVSPTSQTSYQLYVIDANGCTSNTETVTIYVSPNVSLSLSANEDHVCPGEQVLITTSITPGVPPYYIYDTTGQVVMPPIITYPQDTTTYTYTVLDQCGSHASAQITIYTYAEPPVAFSSDTLSGCQPLTVNFNSTYEAASYTWNFGDNDFNNLSFEKDPQHVYEDAGVYDVTLSVVSEEGCEGELTINNMINVYPKPEASFIANPASVSIIKPIIYFTNLSSGHSISYWDFGDGSESTNENPEHTYPIYPTGMYNVQLIVESKDGCLDTAYKEVIVYDEMTFYAPTAFSPDNDGINDVFYVFGNGIDKRYFKMYIFDRWGEIIFETDDMDEGWDGRVNNGEIAKIGTYTWLVHFRDIQGVEREEAGIVSIIR
ncbi:MAG: hypothetical protein Kow0068_13300 [Marinilabiliales bacterium]